MPSKKFTMTQVVDPPSYTRFSEFNQSETKLLVSGIDMRFFYDGFIKIYQFGQGMIYTVKPAHEVTSIKQSPA